MGHTTRNNGKIHDYWPDDTDDTVYLASPVTLSDIREACAKLGAEDVSIEAEYIHTSCLTYDRYDPSDYTNFLVLRRMK